MHADWLKILFLLLDRNTELARVVDIMMARAKIIYILIVKINKFSFFTRECNETSIAGGEKALTHSLAHSLAHSIL